MKDLQFSYLNNLLSHLLNNIDLYDKELKLSPDEYRLKKLTEKPETDIPLPYYFTPTNKYLLNEPRFHFLKELLLALLISGDFYQDNNILNISAFSIKNKESFIIKHNTNPGSLMQLFRKPCRIHCEYCYQDGVPEDFPFNAKKISDEEILDRIKYFEKDRELFHRVVYNVDEIISHPLFFPSLKTLRKKTNDPFSIITNGECLTEDNIIKIKELMPASVHISITSVNYETRKRVTKDKDPSIAINGLKLLNAHRIPFGIRMVAWPGISFNDIEESIAFTDKLLPMYIQILLPGYSKYFKKPFKEDSIAYYKKTIDFITSIRHKYNTDIYFDLNKFEELYHRLDPLVPRINYIMPNSPAYKAGMKKGDIIHSILGRRVFFRKHANAIISKMETIVNETDINMIVIDGNNNMSERIIKKEYLRNDYPYYTWQKDMGIHIDDGLEPQAVQQINHLISVYNSKNAVILSTSLMKYSLSHLLEKWIRIKQGTKLNIHITKNHFWGGNIIIGDLLTVEDFIIAIKEALEDHPDTDLFIIPSSSFSTWKRDMTGRLFYEIQRHFHNNKNFAIEMLYYPRMYS